MRFNVKHIRKDIGTLCDHEGVTPEDIVYLLKELNRICARQDQLMVKIRILIEGKRLPNEKWEVKV